MSDFCEKPCVKASAFKLIYLIAFVLAVFTILGTAFSNLKLWGGAFVFVHSMAPIPKLLNFLLSLIAIIVFTTGVALHFFRIYVTLEMLEETEWVRDRYFVRLSEHDRAKEFFIRAAIVFLGSITAAKIFHLEFRPEDPWLLPLYLTFFYLTLIAWSFFIYRRTMIPITTYVWSDISMLICSLSLLGIAIFDPECKDSVMLYVIVYLIMGGALLISLWKDFFTNESIYLYIGYFMITAISIRKGTIRHEDAEKLLPKWLASKYPEVVKKQEAELDGLLKKSQEMWNLKIARSSSPILAPEQTGREQ